MNHSVARWIQCVGLAVLSVALQAQSTIGISPGATSRTRTPLLTPLVVPITADARSVLTGSVLSSITADVRWSAAKLRLDSISSGDAGWDVTARTMERSNGISSFDAGSFTGTNSVSTIARLHFSVKDQSGASQIQLTVTDARNAASGSLLPVIRTNRHDVCAEPTGRWGETTGDGNVNIIDAQQIARYTVGLVVANPSLVAGNGEVTGDGAVNIIDAQQIARYTVSLSAAARINQIIFYLSDAARAVTAGPSQAFVAVGSGLQLVSSVADSAGTSLLGCASLQWRSQDTSIARVDQSGMVTGVSAGSTSVTVSDSATAASASVSVAVGTGLGVGFGSEQFELIQPGSFLMRGFRPVSLSGAFRMQKTPVTQGQWRAVMGSNPSRNSACGDSCPVEQVTWDDTQAFISALNLANPGAGFRLPSEAEWEYAMRSGVSADAPADLDAVAWYYENSLVNTQPIGRKAPNAWGLYDFVGNVYVWVQDWMADLPATPANNPQGPATGTEKVQRGGSAWERASGVNFTNRGANFPSGTGPTTGLRLVRMP